MRNMKRRGLFLLLALLLTLPVQAMGRGELTYQAVGEEGAELTAEEDAHIIQVAGSIDRCEFYSPQVFRLFEEHMGPYFEGKEPFSQCAQALSRALAKYLQGGK